MKRVMLKNILKSKNVTEKSNLPVAHLRWERGNNKSWK